MGRRRKNVKEDNAVPRQGAKGREQAPPEKKKCETGNYGVLYSEEIKKYGLIKGVEEELFEKALQLCSYDLHLGNKHYLYDAMGNQRPIFLGYEGSDIEKYKSKIDNDLFLLKFPSGKTDELVIPAFGSAIIELLEDVDTLSVMKQYKQLIVGRFDLKLKVIYKGLISQQATQVEPCYCGKLYCFVHNLTSQEIKLRLYERVATIEFLYSGVLLNEKEKDDIFAQAMENNAKKFIGEFAYVGEGIKDVRWLCARGSFPHECGLAPINRKVNDSIEYEIRSYMEKDSTVDWYSERVGKRINDRQGVVKLVLSLIIAALSYFGVSYTTEVKSQMRYFQEQLEFYGDTLAGVIDKDALAAIEAHTESFASTQGSIGREAICIVAVIGIVFLVYYFLFSESFWTKKRIRLGEKMKYEDKRAEKHEREYKVWKRKQQSKEEDK